MTAKILDQGRISETVALDYPVEFEGVVWDKVTVRAPTVADVASFAARVEAASGANLRLPMFDAPDEVLDALHLDDDDRLTEVATRFLPRRFQASPQVNAPDSDNGGSSPTP